MQNSLFEYGIEVQLSNPYTFRASTLQAIVSLLIAVAVAGLILSVVVASLLARRFAIPLRRLTEAARDLTEGDFERRVTIDPRNTGSTEIVELSRQFNQMASRLDESVAIIRRDRDRSRDFLADVSHELRTPIAAMRMFNELLREGADADAATRAEFLESSRQQLERLDWLAQNLLELSKLDSGPGPARPPPGRPADGRRVGRRAGRADGSRVGASQLTLHTRLRARSGSAMIRSGSARSSRT